MEWDRIGSFYHSIADSRWPVCLTSLCFVDWRWDWWWWNVSHSSVKSTILALRMPNGGDRLPSAMRNNVNRNVRSRFSSLSTCFSWLFDPSPLRCYCRINFLLASTFLFLSHRFHSSYCWLQQWHISIHSFNIPHFSWKCKRSWLSSSSSSSSSLKYSSFEIEAV